MQKAPDSFGPALFRRLMRRLRTRLTTLAQRARLVVIQDGDNVYIEEAVPVKYPVRHRLGALGFTDDHTTAARQVMPAANLFDAAASVCDILLRRHLREPRKRFVELALVELPGDHEFHNGGFSGCLYLGVELFDRRWWIRKMAPALLMSFLKAGERRRVSPVLTGFHDGRNGRIMQCFSK